MFRAVCGSDARRISCSYGIVNLIGGADWFACLRGYRLFNVAEPTRPPEKIYTKRRRDSRKDKGGFSILGGNIRTWKKRRGVGGLFVIQSAKQTGAKCIGCAY